MQGIRCLIDGKEALATQDCVWALTSGTRPYVAGFSMQNTHVDALKERTKPVTLTIDSGYTSIDIENLFVIGDQPGPNPYMQTLLLADRRYWWSYSHVLRRFNMRRHIGHKRLAGENLELQPVEPNVWYAPYSLPGGNANAEPWRPLDALRGVLQEIFQSDPAAADDPSNAPNLSFVDMPELASLPFENVQLDDNGQDALKRLLDYLPGVQITVGVDGSVVVYSSVDGAESEPLDDEWAEMKSFGHLRAVTQAAIRPREIHVLFSREFEIRVDFEELEAGATTDRGTEDIWADNVLPSPDYSTDYGNGTVPRGTWVALQSALRAWGTMPSGASITQALIRKCMVPFMDLWGVVGIHGLDDPDNDWAGRIAAIQAHWRRTFRINRHFIDRTLGIYPYRLATINPESGTRAPAICYSDYAVLPGQRMFMQDTAKDDRTFVVNVEGYPQGGGSQPDIDENAKPAPATVVVLDKDQGIVQVQWHIDPLRTYEQIMPSMIEVVGGGGSAGVRPVIPGPTADLSDRQRPIGFNAVVEGGEARLCQMTAGYKAIMILSTAPASPNNDLQLERIVVKPTDIADLLPPGASEGLDDAKGPVMEVRIGPGIETARVAWRDDRREDIYKALGILNDKPGEQPPDITDLIINYGQDGGNAASLQAIARAAAAQVYATFVDRVQGQAAYALKAGARLKGRMQSITFGITPEGVAQMEISIPDDFPSVNFQALLPASTRALVAKLAQPGREN